MKKIAVFLCIFMTALVAQSADLEVQSDSVLLPKNEILLNTNINADELEDVQNISVNEKEINAENETKTLAGKITFEWPNISQIERDARIDEYRKIIFSADILPKYKTSEFKEKYQDFIKDPNYKQHYYLVRNGATTTLDANLSAFYFQERILYMYAVQYKNNPRTIYYYNARGTLEYIDNLSENYPNYPYVSKQYRVTGKLVSAIYFDSKDMQYMYGPNEEFQGIWYKDKMFDRKGRQTLTRTNW